MANFLHDKTHQNTYNPNMKINKIFTLILALTLTLSPLFTSAYKDIYYSDPSFQPIQNLTERGVFFDTADYFYPHQAVTRAEFLTTLMRASNAQNDAEDSLQDHLDKGHWYADYPDVSVRAWYAPAVAWAHDQNYITGNPDGNFYPNQKLTRAEATKLLINIFLDGEIVSGNTPDFTDIETSAWYYPYLISAVNSNLISGYTDINGAPIHKFGPNDTLARGHMAILTERALYISPATAFSAEDDLSYSAKPLSATLLEVKFITAVKEDEALNIANYNLEKLDALSVKKIDSRTYILTTEAQSPGQKYATEIQNITSLNTNRTFSSETSKNTFFGYSTTDTKLLVSAENKNERTPLPAYPTDVEVLRLNLKAEGGGVVLNSLNLKYAGINQATDAKNIKVYLDGEVIEKKSSISSSTRTAQIYFNPPIILEKNEEETLTFTADFGGVPTSGTTHYFKIENNSDLTSSAVVQGDFPLTGTEFRRYAVESGNLVYSYQSIEDPIELGEKTELARFILQAHREDIAISSVSFRYSGLREEEYLDDLKLKIGSRSITFTGDDIDNDEFTFNLSDNPYELDQNTAELIVLTGKVLGGSGSSLIISLNEPNAIRANGGDYDYGVSVSRSDTSETPVAREIEGTALTIRTAPDNPSGYTLYAGESRQTVAKFEVTAEGSDIILENVELKLIPENLDKFNFTELTVHWSGDKVGEYNPSTSSTETLRIEEDLTVPKGRTKTLSVRAKFAETFTNEKGQFKIIWEALTSSSFSFNAKRILDDSALTRSDILPSDPLTLEGGLFKVIKSTCTDCQ